MLEIAVTKQPGAALADGTLISDAHVLCLVAAAHQGLFGFCRDRRIEVPALTYYLDPAKVPADADHIDLWKTPPADAQNAMAWHSEDGGKPDGLVFCSDAQTLFSGPEAFSVLFDHELKELLNNPHVNKQIASPCRGPNGKVYERVDDECCDPVQGRILTVPVIQTDGSRIPVALAAYVTEAWSDPQGVAPFSVSDDGDVLQGPLTCDVTGYGTYYDQSGFSTQEFGPKMMHAAIQAKLRYGRKKRVAR